MERIHREFRYDPEFTTLSTPLTQVLEHRRGVCQDFAHLAIGCIRSRGLAARYVSGYIETVPPPGRQRLVGADASHAWFSVFVPGAGWVDFDPTNNQVPETQHITIAWGRDYSDVTPLKGIIFGGGSMTMKVAVDVLNLDTACGQPGGDSTGNPAAWQT
jgi:transglutaminase-like putative cysteine protease